MVGSGGDVDRCGAGGAGISAVHTYFFSAKNDTHGPSC